MSKPRDDLTAEEVRRALRYESDTGVFYWANPQHQRFGMVAGYTGKPGPRAYTRITLNNVPYVAHRLAWVYVFGEWPAGQLDHIDGNVSNNRITNLRIVDSSGNGQNRRQAQKNNKSGYLGVWPLRGWWNARIQIKGKKKWLGQFKTPEEASAAYLAAKAELHPFQTIAAPTGAKP